MLGRDDTEVLALLGRAQQAIATVSRIAGPRGRWRFAGSAQMSTRALSVEPPVRAVTTSAPSSSQRAATSCRIVGPE